LGEAERCSTKSVPQVILAVLWRVTVQDEQERRQMALSFEDVHSYVLGSPAFGDMLLQPFRDHLVYGLRRDKAGVGLHGAS